MIENVTVTAGERIRPKNRMLLIVPPTIRERSTAYPPLGIASLASYITNKIPEINVRVIDFTVERFSQGRWVEELKSFCPDIIGISVLTINFTQGANIARLTKEFDPNILILMGGAHATAKPGECLGYCDIVIRGEGEETLREVIQDYELEAIKGITYKKSEEIIHNEPRQCIRDLDSLPFPAYHLLKIRKYEVHSTFGIMGSRGCPYNCIFCCTPQMWGRFLRQRSARNIVDEISYIHSEFGAQYVRFFDDTMNIPQHRALEICDEIINSNLHQDIRFDCMVRANKPLVSLELFQRMKKANFVSVGIGVESGSAKVLKSIVKSLSLNEVKDTVKLAHKAGIDRVEGFFMVGSWDERLRDVFKTWRFILLNNIQPSFAICTPYPGTNIWRKLKDNGYIKTNLNWNDFNSVTPITRTNRMSRFSIFLVFIFSILLQLGLSIIRGRRTKRQILRIAAYAWNSIVIQMKKAKIKGT